MEYLESDTDVIGRGIRPKKLNTLLQHIVDVYTGTRLAIIIDDMSTRIMDNTTRLIYFKTHNWRSVAVLKDEFLGYLDEVSESDLLA